MVSRPSCRSTANGWPSRSELTISVPACALSTRSGQLEVCYSDEDIFGELGKVSCRNHLSLLPFAARACLVGWGAIAVLRRCRRCLTMPPGYPGCATLHCSRPASKAVAVACGRPGHSATIRIASLQSAKAGALRQPVTECTPSSAPGCSPRYGTDGVRGVAGEWTRRMPDSVPRSCSGGCEAVADTGAVPRHVAHKKVATDRMPVCCNF